MNATDLMLGDWVYNSLKEKCKVHAISNIFDSNIHLDNYDKPNDGCFELAFEVEPIPLTPEILEKNGFVNVENKQTSTIIYSFRDSLFRIEVYDFSHININSYYTDGYCDTFISSIHELQHVLRLCGINKEIVL